MTGRVYDPRTEPTAIEFALACKLLRPFPLAFSPAQLTAQQVVSYREGILELFDALASKWAELGTLDTDFAVRARAGVFALELQEAIDVVRGNVPGRAVRLAVKEE